MSEGMILDIMQEAFYQIILNSMPMLLVSLVVGLVISIFQTITSIQEQTLTFVPKIISIFIVLMIFGSWIMTNLTDYIYDLWTDFSIYI